MISFFTNNWMIKLGALLIAIALWTYTNGQVRVERTITVQLSHDSIQRVPDSYRISSIQPQVFSVRVSVPVSQVSSLRSTFTPHLQLDSDAPQRGHQSFPITVGMLELNDDIRIEHINPDSVSDVRVDLALITEAYLPVETPQLQGVPNGINATMALEPTRVRVRLTREQFDVMQRQNQRITYEPIVLADIDPAMQKERTEKMILVVKDTQLEVVDSVTATVTLSPGNTSRREVAVPVQILAPRDFHSRFRIELSQPQVVLTLRGPDALLQALQPEADLTAYVTIRSSLEPGIPVESSVRLLGPSWMMYDPVVIRVTAVLAAARPSP
jgi:hypothetical protein